jgi:FeS assembly SUF system protein
MEGKPGQSEAATVLSDAGTGAGRGPETADAAAAPDTAPPVAAAVPAAAPSAATSVAAEIGAGADAGHADAARTDAPAETAAAPVDAAPVARLAPEEEAPLREAIVAALKTVYDPEIPADIYELGLIYGIDIDADRNVGVTMTLTAPGCPVAGEMPVWVENAVNSVPGVAHATVKMSFDPPWDMGRMSDEARLALNMF